RSELVEVIPQVVEPVVGPALPHRLHDCTVMSCLRRVARKMTRTRNLSCAQDLSQSKAAALALGTLPFTHFGPCPGLGRIWRLVSGGRGGVGRAFGGGLTPGRWRPGGRAW